MAMTLRDMDAVRPVNREAVDRHKARMRDEVRAFRLRELRAAQFNTLRKYVSALGGELDITVRLGDETFTLA